MTLRVVAQVNGDAFDGGRTCGEQVTAGMVLKLSPLGGEKLDIEPPATACASGALDMHHQLASFGANLRLGRSPEAKELPGPDDRLFATWRVAAPQQVGRPRKCRRLFGCVRLG